MQYGVKLVVRGRNACFTRPEMKVERVSYDVMTPSAARGILEAIHWKPAIRWVVDRIHVLNPIQFETIRRNEVGSKIPVGAAKSARKNGDLSKLGLSVETDRQQRAMLCLRDVAYGIEAHFELTSKAGGDSPAKHHDMFCRRAAKGQCFQQPSLGVREFPADFELVEAIPPTGLPEADQDRDFGWMLHDIDYAVGRASVFYRARMERGVIDVRGCHAEGALT
ncbi:type I-C CRISPR-associated protein Cas5c [Pontivivens insulae]|uniref:pre-crRNA processing endonuclease n=1 Tax=Pontivivens insulae TaxID=1639689 RepID=A0A2R8AG59_9RHOB|nr:type I-C CRISPR-associated protein Cas5c [Pontivivens insulae]RED10603.1 CRISPR-associated Cas5d family protein [Pontivivens insulae]SPF31186.1 CRISPR pre-crRNA endoribonuclease Cas5d [Pontivivens insulae]